MQFLSNRTYAGRPRNRVFERICGHNEVFSSKNPVYEVGCVSPGLVVRPRSRFGNL
ncbi:hypothetical protein [Phormidium nigroviride]